MLAAEMGECSERAHDETVVDVGVDMRCGNIVTCLSKR
jgi:hypothetical protein